MRLEADLHTHTWASGHAYSSVDEIAQAAQMKGLKIVGITDHGPNMPGGPHRYYFNNIRVIPSHIYGVRVLRGIEANIIDAAGNIDVQDSILEKLDLVLAGLHGGTDYQGAAAEDHTKAMINAIKNPYVHMIVHPGNPAFPIDFEAVVKAAKKHEKALEINDSSFRTSRPGSLPRCQEIARRAADEGIWVSVNSDAHYHSHVGQCEIALKTALEAGIAPEKIINLSSKRVEEYIAVNRKRREGKAV